MPANVFIAGNYHSGNSDIIAAATQIPEIQISAIMETTENALNGFSDYNVNIVCVDVFMSDITGFEISRILREQNTTIKVVIVSESFHPAFLQTTKDLCFDGYISKDSGYPQLVSMFRSILSTGQYFPSRQP